MNDLRIIQIYILDEVVNILEKNNLEYWLDSGTLLGAKRHEGFIPWDDDIDISVHIDDYKKIVDILVKELPSDLKLYNNGEDALDTDLAPIKIFYLNSVVQDLHTSTNTHIFIDLFVYSPVNPKYINSRRANLMRYLYILKSNRMLRSFKGIKKYLYIFLRSIISKRFIEKISNKIREKNAINDYLAYDPICWYPVVYHHKSEIYPLKKMKFEGKYYNVPNDVDSFLARKYGNDFMKLPPVEKRVGNHIAGYKITKFPTEK